MDFSPTDLKIRPQSPGLGCRDQERGAESQVWGAEPSPSIPPPQGSPISLGSCCRAQVPFPAWRDNQTASKPPVPSRKRGSPSLQGGFPLSAAKAPGTATPAAGPRAPGPTWLRPPRARCSPQTSQSRFQRSPCSSSLPVLPQTPVPGVLSPG